MDNDAIGYCCYGGMKPRSACLSCAAWKPETGNPVSEQNQSVTPYRSRPFCETEGCVSIDGVVCFNCGDPVQNESPVDAGMRVPGGENAGVVDSDEWAESFKNQPDWAC